MSFPIPFPSRENAPFLGLVLLACLLAFTWQGPLAASLVAVAGVLAHLVYFRDPPRAIPAQAGVVLSPADGRIVRIEKARDPYANRDALRISVFMSLFSLHGNRASVDGVIRQVEYIPGQLVNTDLDTASRHHERNAVVIESNGQLVTLVQVAGLIARRILCWVKPGDTLTRGQRYGLIRFGARVDVYLPPNAVPKVAPGDKVSATTTILATLNKA
ncbi:MAG: phosphatidylserine decarboxylase [Aquabacterium sp.]|uniref:phosphatidylserine decarboxylase n=1 Tax=Aquabacterium sp. TaxID=1872578 RepID=UPI00121779C2|nr:phosphatidylserine decarboxylase [Aquabacterium sp.]TAK87406.1 MAG: phosphatidylserine decarboxylase [Aquabacterium sp.]